MEPAQVPSRGCRRGEPDEWIEQPFLGDQFQHGRTFPAGNDEPFDEIELLGATDENGVGA